MEMTIISANETEIRPIESSATESVEFRPTVSRIFSNNCETSEKENMELTGKYSDLAFVNQNHGYTTELSSAQSTPNKRSITDENEIEQKLKCEYDDSIDISQVQKNVETVGLTLSKEYIQDQRYVIVVGEKDNQVMQQDNLSLCYTAYSPMDKMDSDEKSVAAQSQTVKPCSSICENPSNVQQQSLSMSENTNDDVIMWSADVSDDQSRDQSAVENAELLQAQVHLQAQMQTQSRGQIQVDGVDFYTVESLPGEGHDHFPGKKVTFKIPEERKENVAIHSVEPSQVTLLPQFLSQSQQAAPGWYSLLNSQVLKRQALSPLAIPSASAVQNNLVGTLGQLSQKSSTPAISRMSTPQTPIQQQHQLLQPVQPDHFVYTPHPKHGQLFYMPQMSDGSSPILAPTGNYMTSQGTPSGSGGSPAMYASATAQTPRTIPGIPVALNSSGEENQCSPDFSDGLSAPLNTSLDGLSDTSRMRLDLPFLTDEDPCREQHNMKERKRRARIKDACDLMRKLVPGMSDKTDKATVFEFAARYIHFLKSFTGNQHDKDFLLKYSPY